MKSSLFAIQRIQSDNATGILSKASARIQLNRHNRFSETSGDEDTEDGREPSNGPLNLRPDSLPKNPKKMSMPVCVARSITGYTGSFCPPNLLGSIWQCLQNKSACVVYFRRTPTRLAVGRKWEENGLSVRSYRIAVTPLRLIVNSTIASRAGMTFPL
jgi:hypothetical protein